VLVSAAIVVIVREAPDSLEIDPPLPEKLWPRVSLLMQIGHARLISSRCTVFVEMSHITFYT
jgi:hypothetical protein